MTNKHTTPFSPGAAWNPPAQPAVADAAATGTAAATAAASSSSSSSSTSAATTAGADALGKVRQLHETRFRAISCLGNMVGAHMTAIPLLLSVHKCR